MSLTKTEKEEERKEKNQNVSSQKKKKTTLNKTITTIIPIHSIQSQPGKAFIRAALLFLLLMMIFMLLVLLLLFEKQSFVVLWIQLFMLVVQTVVCRCRATVTTTAHVSTD